MVNKYKNNKGFTLIEMVIVVTIIGTLSGLGFMKFGDIQEKTRKNADYTAAANLATATSLYLNDNPNLNDGSVQTITIATLVGKYISSEPKPQTDPTGSFSISASGDDITIKVGADQFYPKP